jgi:anion-transporting  ArsA/GET3 family ATPase
MYQCLAQQHQQANIMIISTTNMNSLHEVIKENDRLREKLERVIKLKNYEVIKEVPTQVLLEELLIREKDKPV